MRNGLKRIASEREQWAGIPMPLEGFHLVVEPTYPNAEGLAAINRKEYPAEDGTKIRNSFWSKRLHGTVYIYEENGKIRSLVDRASPHHFTLDLSTLGCMDAWGLEQEHKALQLLGSLIRHRQLKQYILTGMFLERSKRSGLTYCFRRLKPTVVIDAGDETSDQPARIVTALCMHPIAYYSGTWGGAMCPTDDVVAHLMLMRGDEHMLWRRCNQHSPERPEAGL